MRRSGPGSFHGLAAHPQQEGTTVANRKQRITHEEEERN